MLQGSDHAKADEGENKGEVNSVENCGIVVDKLRDCPLPGFRKHTHRGDRKEDKQHKHSHRMIAPTLGEHASQRATHAARQPTPWAWYPGRCLDPTNRYSCAMRWRESGKS